jgi:AcrR family transcriptional regulator
MTTNAVARRAGVSIGSVYQYFPNKSAILVCLLERHIRQVQPLVTAGLSALADPSRPFETVLQKILLELIAAHELHGPRLQQVLSEEVPHPPSIRRLRAELERDNVRMLSESLQRRADLRPRRPELAAQLCYLVAEAVTYWLSHSAPASFDRRACVDETVRMLVRYLQDSR